ncbi:MAG: hypothetical protein ABI772_11085 [Bacteroidota bacterium]
MGINGVITGDIVASRDISSDSRQQLYQDIKAFLNTLQKEEWIEVYEVFRGDSFQCIVKKTEEALRVALIIRAFIRSYVIVEDQDENSGTVSKNKMAVKGYFPGNYDIRLSIGIGTTDFVKKDSLAHSDGEAFYLSGDALDDLKEMPYRMVVKTLDKQLNESLEPSIFLLDANIQKWTNTQAEVILFKLKNLKEEDIAAKLMITQSAVNQRTKSSQWYAIEKLLIYFAKAIKERNT